MASEIVVALIGGGAGLVTGAISSLVAPWANWGIEQQRLRRERRVERIKEWRHGVSDLKSDEQQHGEHVRYQVPLHEQGSLSDPIRYGTFMPPADRIDIETKDWWDTLKLELSDSERNQIEALNKQPLTERLGLLPKTLAEHINRIESKWEPV